jgi:hypothetical protein
MKKEINFLFNKNFTYKDVYEIFLNYELKNVFLFSKLILKEIRTRIYREMKCCIKYIFTPNIKSRLDFIKKNLYTRSNLDTNIRRLYDTENMFKLNAESYQDHKIYRFINKQKDFEKNINSFENKKKKKHNLYNDTIETLSPGSKKVNMNKNRLYKSKIGNFLDVFKDKNLLSEFRSKLFSRKSLVLTKRIRKEAKMGIPNLFFIKTEGILYKIFRKKKNQNLYSITIIYYNKIRVFSKIIMLLLKYIMKQIGSGL